MIATWAMVGAGVGAIVSFGTRRLLSHQSSSVLTSSWTGALLTAFLFGTLAWGLGSRFDLLPASYLAAVGVPLAVIDILEQRLPTKLVMPSHAVLATLYAVASVLHPEDLHDLVRAALGTGILAAFYLVLALASGGGLGAGDVKLGGVLGLALGWSGWSVLIAATFLGWFAAAMWLVVRVARRPPRNSPLPMGPFLLFGALLAITLVPR
ncbi:prepilin peptidase [Kutzneria sp. NPDC051319]|uniref:prepilin peptidase n=1 Tax=Kutzneria sp. NPDC051319 TaxID=3155047 RepID=UPI0034309801